MNIKDLKLYKNGEDGRHNAVFYDKETKVEYYFIDRIGITVLLNADGTPKLYEEEWMNEWIKELNIQRWMMNKILE